MSYEDGCNCSCCGDKHYNNVKKLRKEVRQETLRKVFAILDKDFAMKHACSCEKWCECWKEFKKRELSKK